MQNNKEITYIKAVVVLMTLLLISRVIGFFAHRYMDTETIVSSIVEAGFLILGILVLRKRNEKA
jgi:ABC-type polysaccharide/polyol phosphate export permease